MAVHVFGFTIEQRMPPEMDAETPNGFNTAQYYPWIIKPSYLHQR